MPKLWFGLAVLSACVADPVVEPEVPPEVDGELQWSPPLPPLYTVRLHAIRTANDDGTERSPVTATTVTNLLPEVNAIFASARVRVVFDPVTDFESRDSTLLNQTYDVTVDLEDFTDPDVEPPTINAATYSAARRAAADEHRDKITVFFASPRVLRFDDDTGQWALVHKSGGSSSRTGRYVNWREGLGGEDLAHELGHYLHNQHPFVGGISTVGEAAAKIKAYLDQGNPVADGLLALDGDRDYVRDTPPDAGGTLLADVNQGDKCGPDGSVTIPVSLPGMIRLYTLEPDRGLVMSYFKGCELDNHFSSDQARRIWDALVFGNRRGLVERPAPPLYPKLALLDEAAAGSIADVKIARVRDGRVVTATTGTTTLKLIAWDVATNGTITRRGDIAVGEVGGRFEVTHGGLDQVVVAYRTTSGGLALKTYRVESAGTFTALNQESAGGITDLALVRINPTTLVTPVRLPTGILRSISWSIDAHGKLTRMASGDSGTVDSIEAATAFHADTSGGFTLFTRYNGNLMARGWKVDGDDRVVPLGAELAGDIPAGSSASELDFDLAASVVRTSSNLQKVIAWRTSYTGSVTRGGDATTTMACNRVASAAIGTRFLATACRRADLKMDLRLFDVSAGGATVTQRSASYYDLALEVAMAPVNADQVVIASKSAAGELAVRTFGVESAR